MICTVDGCDQPTRTRSAAMCEKHYYRMRRNGTLELTSPQRPTREPCRVGGCRNLDTGPHGLCAKHKSRLDRNGDPELLVGPHVRFGEENPSWQGKEIKYRAVHERVRSVWGSCREYRCVDCDAPANHWSYNHTDPDGFLVRHSNGKLYPAGSPEHYSPRCVKCHKAFDLARKAEGRTS